MTNRKIGAQEPQGGKLYRGLAETFGPFLGARSFECVSYKYDDRSSGNEIVEFVSGPIRLRLVNDGSQFHADLAVSDAQEGWVSTDDLLQLLGVSQQNVAASTADMAALAKLVTQNFDAMLGLLAADKVGATRERLAALRQARGAPLAAAASRRGQTLH